MDEGLLILRVLLAAVLFAHATQKTLGWLSGPGIAAASELLAAVLIGLGLLTPVGALVAVGTMAVAGLTMHLSAGKLWNAAGGGEYPYVLAAVAVVLGFTGPGARSVDAALVDAWPLGALMLTPPVWVGVAIVVVGVLAAAPFAALLRRNLAASRS